MDFYMNCDYFYIKRFYSDNIVYVRNILDSIIGFNKN